MYSPFATPPPHHSPLPVSHLPYDLEDGVIRSILQLPDQLCELLWPAQDDRPQVASDFARQRQQDVWVLTQIGSQPDDGRLRRWRHQSPLHFAQVGGLHIDTVRDLTKAEPKIVVGSGRAGSANVVTKTAHVDCVLHSTHHVNSRGQARPFFGALHAKPAKSRGGRRIVFADRESVVPRRR